jgi:hypothetical protein
MTALNWQSWQVFYQLLFDLVALIKMYSVLRTGSSVGETEQKLHQADKQNPGILTKQIKFHKNNYKSLN